MIQRPVGPGRGVRCVELPARLLDRGRRHRVGAGRGLPGGGQGPFGASRHGRDRGRGDPRRDPARLGCLPACSRSIQGGQRDVGRGAGAAPADPGRGLHRLARRGPGALRPLRAAARTRSRSSASWARSTRCSCCPPPSPRGARRSRTGWAGSLTMGAGQFCTNPGHRRGDRRSRRPRPSSRRPKARSGAGRRRRRC